MREQKPFYPAVSLPVALEKLNVLFDSHEQTEITPQEAFACWGYKSNSRTGKKLIKTLESFGLVDSIALEENILLKISTDALANLYDTNVSASRVKNAIEQFSRSPDVYGLLWKKWQTDLPPDKKIADFLINSLGCSKNNVGKLISDYKSSLEFVSVRAAVDARGDLSEDTDLEFEDEDNDVVELIISRYRQSSNAEEDTDLEMDHISDSPAEAPGTMPKRSLNDIELDERDRNSESSPIDFDVSKVSSESRNKVEYAKAQGESRLSPLMEIGSYSVSSNCNFLLMADGVVDRNAFEALVAQLTLQLETGEFDGDD